MIWLAILVVLAIGFVFMCVDKVRKISRKEQQRRNVIDEMEVHELLKRYKDFEDYGL